MLPLAFLTQLPPLPFPSLGGSSSGYKMAWEDVLSIL